MSENMTQAKVSQEVTVNINVEVKGRTYSLHIPSGVPYDEAYVVALEIGAVIKKMQEQVAAHNAEQAQKEEDKANG